MGTPTGTYRDPDKARQLCLFDGMYKGDGCAPTDVDFSRDYNQSLLLEGEFKFGETKLTLGQRLNVEFKARVFKKADVPYVFGFARHQVPTDRDFYAKDTIVAEVLIGGEWTFKYMGWTLAELEAFLLVKYARYLR